MVKKIFVLLVAIIGFGICANAQTKDYFSNGGYKVVSYNQVKVYNERGGLLCSMQGSNANATLLSNGCYCLKTDSKASIYNERGGLLCSIEGTNANGTLLSNGNYRLTTDRQTKIYNSRGGLESSKNN
jgi:hypothetical protein